MRKLLPALVIGVVLLIGALPAAAQTGVDAKISGVSNGQAVTGSVIIKGSASATTGVDTIKISINGSVVKTESFGGVQQNASTSYPWHTTGKSNGDYVVKVSATSKGGRSDSASARALVDNEPATVTGLTSSHSGGTVSLSWDPNPESDLIGYRVSRDGTSLGQTSATSMTDRPGAGTYSYRVVAVRSSPTQPDGKSGGAAGTWITVRAAGGSGSGSGGSNSGGGKSGSSVPGYGKAGGGKKGSKGSGGAAGAPGYGGGFTVGGRSLSGIGLPNNLTPPGSRLTLGSGPIAAPTDETFSEELPYDLESSRNDRGQTEHAGGDNVAALSNSTLIPPDGLRWVAAGLWLLVTAALLKFLERRVAARETSLAGGTPELRVAEDEAA